MTTTIPQPALPPDTPASTVYVATAQLALDEARRAVDVQLGSIESFRNRGIAEVGIVGVVGSLAGLPSENWKRVVIIMLALPVLLQLWELLRDRDLVGIMDPAQILDDSGWQAQTDEAVILSYASRYLWGRYIQQQQLITKVLRVHRRMLVLSLALIVLFIAWGKQ